MPRRVRAVCVVCLAVLLCTAPACSSSLFGEGATGDAAREAVMNVATMRGGTLSALRDRRGRGPFREYDVSPEVLLRAVERAAGQARGRGGHPVKAIFVSKRRSEVVAKEREPALASSESYRGPFLSAMLAVVHESRIHPGKARLELHATHSGPFHLGAVNWQRDMPRWIEQALRQGCADEQ